MNGIPMYKGRECVYLDNAATTFPKPPCVVSAVRTCIEQHGGNPGRSAHRLSYEAADIVYRAREDVADLLHTEHPEHVVFTQNATYALNMSIKCAARYPCHVLLSDMEHNATLRPIHALAQRGELTYSVFSTRGDLRRNIEGALRRDTRMLVCTLASNICGREIPLALLSEIGREHGLYTVADASQLLGHTDNDLSKHPVDVLCAPAHKGLLGIQGCGLAVFSAEPPGTWVEGGSGSDSERKEMPALLPERMEAGTLPTPAIAALSAGIRYISQKGVQNIEQKLARLVSTAACELEKLPHVYIQDTVGHGILSLLCDTHSPERLAAELDRRGICVRSGLQCAPLAHTTIGTADSGVVRISFSFLNDEKDIAALLRALTDVIK